MKITQYINNLTRKEATLFRKNLVKTMYISPCYARHLCNGTRPIPVKYAFLFEHLTKGKVTRFDIAPQEYTTS